MMGIRFKDYNDAYFLDSLHPTLKDILSFVISYAHDELDTELEVTSVYRSGSGVHSTDPIRGIDVVPVDRDIGKMEAIRAKAISEYDYGREPFEVCPPVRHGSAPHVHLQARTETRRIENAHT